VARFELAKSRFADEHVWPLRHTPINIDAN
jgi:hypothetical protein